MSISHATSEWVIESARIVCAYGERVSECEPMRACANSFHAHIEHMSFETDAKVYPTWKFNIDILYLKG